MLQNLRHPKVLLFVLKPVAIMMEYECFDFLPFGVDAQVSDLLDLLHCLDRIQAVLGAIITVSQSTISFRFAKYRKPFGSNCLCVLAMP